MPPVSTLSDLFEHARLSYRIYHLGRRVMPCSRAHFRAFEEEKVAWESPFTDEARIALIIDDPEGHVDQSRIWCLSFPLDEQGQLQPVARDSFLRRLLEAGIEASVNSEVDGQYDPMKNNPLAYAPNMMAKAMLHAWLWHENKQPLSDAAQQVAHYMMAPMADDAPQWAELSVQGIADWAVRLTTEEKELLAQRLQILDDNVVSILCQCLEHAPFQHEGLAKGLRQRTAPHPHLKSLGLRAIIGTQTNTAIRWLDELLSDHPDIETLAIISLRGWQHLEHAERLPAFLNALAANPQVNIRDTLRDLALIPRLRLPVIMALQSASPASALGRRLGEIGLGRN